LGVLQHIPMKAIVVALVSTIGLVFLADRVQEIGERIPMVLLSMWAGSATIAASIFSARGLGPYSSACAQVTLTDSQLWTCKMRLTGTSLLPLAWMPLVEIRHSGYDPALWLMNGILIVSLCGVPYWLSFARSIIGAVVLSICSLSLLWHFSAWALFTIIIRMEAVKNVSTVDTSRTLHAFLAPEYRIFFYCLCGMALLIYCPVMMWIGYRRFLVDRSTQRNAAPNSRPPLQLPSTPEIQTPDSRRTPPPGGCG
jgi:hypothetical protein